MEALVNKLVSLIIVSLVFVFSSNGHTTEIEIMTYNVENLFDTSHDEGKNDWEYLPLAHPGKAEGCQQLSNSYYREKCFSSDWTESKLKLKLNALKNVILREQGKLPDILALVEIENKNVAKKLADTLGYKDYFVTNGPDKRGIDLGIFYNSGDNLLLKSKKVYNRNNY